MQTRKASTIGCRLAASPDTRIAERLVAKDLMSESRTNSVVNIVEGPAASHAAGLSM